MADPNCLETQVIPARPVELHRSLISLTGGAVQLNLNLSPKVNLFNEFTYKSRDGYYGIKSSTTIQYTRHEGNLLEYNGMFSLKTKSDLHSVRLVAGLEKLDNYEKIYKRITTSAGNTIIEYYGGNPDAGKKRYQCRN